MIPTISKTNLDIDNKFEIVDLSSAQFRLYFIQELEKESCDYNIFRVFKHNGNLDFERVDEIFKTLIKRHESLRTTFHKEDDRLYQKIHQNFEFSVNSHYYEDKGDKQKVIESFNNVFDLSVFPLIRVDNVKIGKDNFLILNVHHIVADGASVGILMNEFVSLYFGMPLEEIKNQFKDFANWQNQQKKEEIDNVAKNYWVSRFGDELPILDLSTEYPITTIKNSEGERAYFRLDEDLSAKVKELARKKGTTLYMFLLSVYNILLSKYTQQEDIIVGTPILGRSRAGFNKTVGMFVNTLPMRNFPQAGLSFEAFLQDVRKNVLDAFKYQNFQFEDLIENIDIDRDLNRNPLFNTTFAFQSFEDIKVKIGDLEIEQKDEYNKYSKFDISFNAFEKNNKIEFLIEYSKSLYGNEFMNRLFGHFKQILLQVVENHNIKLGAICILSKCEKDQILNKFNDTKADYAEDKTIIDLFEEQVAKTPDNTALIFGEKKLSYKQFHNKVNNLVQILQNNSTKNEDIVAVISERSFEMMIAIFAILKTGAAYLPIDPSYPRERIDHILCNSKASVVLTTTMHKDKIPRFNGIIELNKLDDATNPNLNITSKAKPEGLAYVIYTSGSTGNPKGVMIEHHSVVNRINWMQKQYPINEGDVILQKTPIVFDVSVWELFWWSLQGASLCLLEPGGEKDPQIICKEIKDNSVTTLHFVPSMLQPFLEHIQSNPKKVSSEISPLKYVFASGEALSPLSVNTFNQLLCKANTTKLVNLYGPTEATVDVSYFNCFENDKYKLIPIGKPIDNIRLYIINKYENLQPIGVAGELFIAGVGLARGYINNKRLTNEKFIENPIIKGERIYRTGDLARWLPDGNIEFLGRIDHQVKIRGFRIEVGEIETALIKHEKISDAIVIAKGTEGDKYLCAYFVSQEELEINELRTHLSNGLPEYMVPSYFVRLEVIPLTSNGKADRKSLPEPEIKAESDYVPPSSETEEKLVEIWSEVLKIPKKLISIKRNFFELGGHSLKAILLGNKIHKEFEVELPLQTIFSHQTVQSMANYIITVNQFKNSVPDDEDLIDLSI